MREISEQHTGLGAGDAPPERRHRAAGHPLAHSGGERFEQSPHRPHVGRDPRGAVDDLRTRRAGGAEAGVVGDQLLGERGDRREVGPQGLGEVGRRQRIFPGDAAGDPLGEAPVEGVEGRGPGIVRAALRLEAHDCFCPRHFGRSTFM